MPKKTCRVLSLCLVLASPAALAQADISLQVGGQKYQASGQGECKSEPRASIYGVPAALYQVSHRAARQSLQLTLWQPRDAKPTMISLNLSIGGKTYAVDTVRAGGKADAKGSGKASVEQSGRGGVINIDAVAASGEKIMGRIQCRAFGGIQAEGG